LLIDEQQVTPVGFLSLARKNEIRRIFQSPPQKEQCLLSNCRSRFGFDVLKRDQHRLPNDSKANASQNPIGG
jgi:hypothetical protein